MLTYFQCDLCHLRNMKGIDPTKLSQEDERFMIAIRRASLDAFWIREPRTVKGNLTMLSKMRTMSEVFQPKTGCSLSLFGMKRKLFIDRRNRTNSQ